MLLMGWLESMEIHNFEEKRTFTNDDLDRVMGLLCIKGACYPSEIARDLTLEISQVNAIITRAINEGVIERLLPDRLYPQALIKCRIAEMWSIGVTGYENFTARSWFVLTPQGIDLYASKHSGEHRQISQAYTQLFSH